MMAANVFREVLPKHGILYQEMSAGFALCKPKLMPLKSMTLEKMEVMQKEAQDRLKEQDAQEREAEKESFQQGMAEVIHRNSNIQNENASWQLGKSNQSRFDSSSYQGADQQSSESKSNTSANKS